VLLVTFDEILWCIFCIIERDFEQETQIEIYKCLNCELQDSIGMCFTGKINRLVNSLNGFSDLVEIELSDAEQISIIVKKAEIQLGLNYSIFLHKQIVEKEMIERGFPANVIRDWLDAIENLE
jgi:hypothetical protein